MIKQAIITNSQLELIQVMAKRLVNFNFIANLTTDFNTFKE